MESYLVSKFVEGSISSSTARSYNTAFSKWEVFANDRSWSVVPATPDHVAIFIAQLGEGGTSAGRVDAITAAIAHRHAAQALPSPIIHPTVRKVIAGVKRSVAKPVVHRTSLSPSWPTYQQTPAS